MILSDTAVKRPVFATVFSLLLVAFGLLSFRTLPLRELPDIDAPVVSVWTFYRGASAEVVDTRVTQIIEDAISGIEGINTIQSSSSDGRSWVTIEFKLTRDIDGAANDVRDAVSRVGAELPESVDPPEISKVDADSQPIMWMNAISNSMSSIELADFVERNVADRFAVLDGVARVIVGGAGRFAMRIYLDRKALAARGLTVADVENALRRENIELPAGQIESDARQLSIRVIRSYFTVKDFASLPLGQGQDGHIIRLGEVSQVEVGSDIDHVYFRQKGVPQVGIGIVKQSTANTLDVARASRMAAGEINKTLPEGMTIRVNFDTSTFIEEAVSEVYFTLAIAMALVVLVIYLFLGSARAALIPGVTVPVCLIASFSALAVLGLSINLLTLLALILSIGLVVDDSIVVLENIQRRIDLGEPPLVAAFVGTRQVAFAVIATTTVVIAVFVPIMFLQGDIGRLFTELGITVSAAVAFSSLVALTLSPMLCSKILKPSSEKRGVGGQVNRAFSAFHQAYGEALSLCLRRPVLVVPVVVLSIAAVYGLWRLLPSELVPQEDRGAFMLRVNGPEGASFDYTVKQMQQVEAILASLSERGEVQAYLTRVPGSFGESYEMHTGLGMVMTTPARERDRSTGEILNELTPRLHALPGIEAFAFMPQPLARGFGGDRLQFVIGGSDYTELKVWRDAMLERAHANPRLNSIQTDHKETKPQLRVSIDRTRAADLGVSIETIGRTLEAMLGSRKVTTYASAGEEYDVILRVRAEDRRQPDDLTNIYVRSQRTGELIPLSNLVSLREVGEAGSLARFNRMRAITLSAGLAPGYTMGEALEYLEQGARELLPPTAQIDYRGASRAYKESSTALFFTFALALVVVFLVLAAQFESFVHPVVIMLTVPLAVAGGLFGLYMIGSTLNIYSQIGIVILIGLAAKNGILIVEFANQLRDEGLDFDEALKEAAKIRLRPIIMTGLSTAFGALPLVLAGGPGAASRHTIGMVIFAGVLFATLLTTFVVPMMYSLIARNTSSPQAVSRRLETMLRGQGQGLAPGE